MSTRSIIGLLHPDESVEAVYCHFNGHTGHNGALLLEHYADPPKVRALIELGSLRELGRTPAQSTAYVRDGGEPMGPGNAPIRATLAGFPRQEFNYLYSLDQQAWLYARNTQEFRPLTRRVAGLRDPSGITLVTFSLTADQLERCERLAKMYQDGRGKEYVPRTTLEHLARSTLLEFLEHLETIGPQSP